MHDNALNSARGGQDVPVRRTRVVMRRYFKIDRTYTDDNGRFSSNKHCNNKVNIIVKFKSTDLAVRGLRGIRFYQLRFPIKHSIGKYRGNLNNIDPFVFQEGTDINSRQYRNWWAAQLMNAHLEFNEMAVALGIGTLPRNMKILLTNYGAAGGAGSTPMNMNRKNNGLVPREWIEFFAADPARAGVVKLFNFLVQGIFLNSVDMTLGYNVNNAWRSDRVKALMFHELGHAGHYNKVGAVWWNALVYAEQQTVIKWSGRYDPYGDGSDNISSEYISVAESWAEHVARVMCDRRYGTNSTTVIKQNHTYSNIPVTGLSSHLNALEDFDPDRPVTDDPFRWIPEGLYFDMFDVINEANPVLDGVAGYTNRQFFDALDSDVRSMPEFRGRLLQENGFNQQVIDLFNEYHY